MREAERQGRCSPATTPDTAWAKKVHTVPQAPQEKECWTALQGEAVARAEHRRAPQEAPVLQVGGGVQGRVREVPSCKAIIFRKNVQCTPIARPYESAYESSTTQQVANYLC